MNTTAIVPGDKIKPKSNSFTWEDVMNACKKRYRTSVCIDNKEIAMQQPTLQQAVQIIIDDSIYHDGHDRHVILTTDELKAREKRNAAIGIVRCVLIALNKADNKVGISAKDVQKAISIQIGLRKIKIYSIERFTQALLHVLKNKKIIKNVSSNNPSNFVLAKYQSNELTDAQVFELCPEDMLEAFQ